MKQSFYKRDISASIYSYVLRTWPQAVALLNSYYGEVYLIITSISILYNIYILCSALHIVDLHHSLPLCNLQFKVLSS